MCDLDWFVFYFFMSFSVALLTSCIAEDLFKLRKKK